MSGTRTGARRRATSQGQPWAPARQRERGAVLFAAVRQAARSYFDPSGACLLGHVVSEGEASTLRRRSEVPFFLREAVHSAMAFLHGDAADAELANRILDRLALSSCDFTTMSLIEMLVRCPERLTSANRRRLRDHIAAEIEHVRKPHNAHVGFNDNFPSMATFIFVVGGEILGRRRVVRDGVDNLLSMADLLSRRGFISEYNSPTYSGVTLHGLDETANEARDPQARKLARMCAERVWLDVALHWHPEISFHAGPFSRAYHGNSMAWSGLTAIVMWIVFGDVIVPGPLARLFGPEAEASFEGRTGVLPFCRAGCGGYAGTVHRFPDYVGDMVLRKRYPFRVRGSAEHGTFHVGDYRRLSNGACVHLPGRSCDFPADSVGIQTYMEKDLAIGTAGKVFLNGGQTDSFHALWRRSPRVRTWGDIRAVFARYLVNEAQPEDRDSKGLLVQQGIVFAAQDDRRALVLAHPNGAMREGVRSLKLSLVLQEQTSPVDEIWIGGRRLDDGDGESPSAAWVILKDGPVLLAFYPLAATDAGRRVLIRSVRENGYRVISFYNYEGKARDVDALELKAMQNGFVFEASTVREHPTVPALLRELRAAQVSDTTLMENRRVRYRRGGRELFLWIDPIGQSVKAAAVNGRAADGAPLAADGLDLERVPLLGRGVIGQNLDWWRRIAARPALASLEGVSGRCVD